ncbi:hypothetical protein T07_5537 [Trichinella nelsoni]|uniref:Uncharacterized protein n=1 Tax=Trichinella nelsoni TaxID=6336 RepID=A0A0V0S5J6_9BILA|nr:hypothetical protein T07_5537 [Trichinella nelsoni]
MFTSVCSRCGITNIRNPRRRLRLCPRANKNLHIPAGYAESILLHNFCLQGAMPRAFPQAFFSKIYII